ncbi:MAG: DUF2461 domain-containing protein [Christensenellales bacterium]|nr:DUF2461 domain-containing protein [Christensenellales bacterium]
MFTGLPREMLAFFAALRFNNNRAFFEENRAIYERFVRRPLLELAEALAPVVREIDPDVDVRPQRAVSRIYRDLRFRRDKTPYREYMWIGFRHPGESREETCGFYFDVSADEANWGCGYYHMQAEFMQNLRARIVTQSRRVERIVTDPAFAAEFSLMGPAYQRQHAPPPGLCAPLAELYRKKTVYAEHHVTDFERLFSPALADDIASGFRTLAPFYALLRECMVRTGKETKL